MYVTRSCSLYKRSLQLPTPPDGLDSGYLYIYDSLCSEIVDLPFPQDRLLYAVEPETWSGDSVFCSQMYLIPVVNQPPSSNRYYVILRSGHDKGKACVSSKDEDMVTGTTCCCGNFNYIPAGTPRPLDPRNIYQQFEFSHNEDRSFFYAKSVATDGHVPDFLGDNSAWRTWTVETQNIRDFPLSQEAKGVNESLRATLPSFDFPVSQQSSTPPVVVGKWYIPFMFIKENTLEEQVTNSLFYKMTLEQRWERIFETCRQKEPEPGGNNSVIMNMVIPTREIKITGTNALRNDTNDGGFVVWLKNTSSSGQEQRMGLSSLLVEQMMWEVERFGWVKGDVNHVTELRSQFEQKGHSWTKFGCYVLVETFVLRRFHGPVVLTYDFVHTNQLRTKWE